MHISRTRFWVVLLVALSLLAAACGSSDDESSTAPDDSSPPSSSDEPADEAPADEESADEAPADEESADEELSVGLVTINLQALFFNQINEGAQRVADADDVNLEVFNANNDPVAQNDAIENFVTSGVDALIVLAIDVEGILPALADARAAGVPVVAVDAIVEEGAADVQVGTDNAAAGAQMGDFLLEISGGTGEVGVVGALNSFIQNLRQEGFEDTVVAGGMEIAGVVDGQNVQEEALAAAENLMTGNPGMEFVYATGEPALIGLVSAVQSQGAQDNVTVVGWDLSDAAVDGLREGFVAGVVQQDTFRFGEEGMRAAIALAQGRPVADEIPIDTFIVTPDNVDDFVFFLG